MNNRKRTTGRRIYYQRINRNEAIYDVRIVGIRNKWYHRLLLWLKLMDKSRIAKRKSIVVGYHAVPTNKVIKHVLPSPNQVRIGKIMEDKHAKAKLKFV
jgi:hypothetical protein